MSYGTPTTLQTLADLLPELTGHLPGCTPVLIRKTMQTVCDEFTRYTGAFRAVVGPFDMLDGVSQYPVELPVNAKVSVIHKVFIYGRECDKTEYAIVKNEDGDTIVAFPSAPNLDMPESWTVDASMVPFRGCERFPKSFFEDWSHAIVSGTLAELCADDSARWHNAVKAAQNAQKYHAAKQDAAIKLRASQSRDGRLTFAADDCGRWAGDFS